MKYLLDTNICIYTIRNRPLQVRQKFLTVSVGDVVVSSITVAELQHGVERNQNRQQAATALEQFLLSIWVVDFDTAAAIVYGKLRRLLEKNGTPIGSFDTLIAAHALSLDVTLVTNNQREFQRIPELKLENWVAPENGKQ